MWRATIKGLLAKKLRLVLTALSVVLGVGFVSGTYVLTDTMNAAFTQLFGEVADSSDLTIRAESAFAGEQAGPGGGGGQQRQPVPEELLETVRAVEGVAAASGSVQGYAQMIDPVSGDAIGGFGPPTFGLNWNETSEGILVIREGAPPAASGEVAVDAATARAYDLHPGQRIRILFQGPAQEFTITGAIGFGDADNLAGATIAFFETETAQRVLERVGMYDSIEVIGEEGVSATSLRTDVQVVLPDGVEAVTTASVADEQSALLQEGLGFFQTALLAFAGIALFVGAFIIFNTFTIIVSQRSRELALLRVLGASRRQVLLSVLAEALVVGLVASALGVLAGIGIAVLLQGLLEAFNIDLPSTAIQVRPRTIIAGVLVGTIVTLIAAIVPARRAARVAPVQALREAEEGAAPRLGKRLAAGGVITVLGVGALLYGLFSLPSNAVSLVGLGLAFTFVGVAVLSPLIAAPVASLLGAPMASMGVPGRIGRRNAMRNPRRTATTASALMIGLGLVAMVAILAASLKASFTQALERTIRADYTVAGTTFNPFSADVVEQVRGIDGVVVVTAFRQAAFRVNDASSFLSAADPATMDAVTDLGVVEGSLADLGTDDVLVHADLAEEKGWALGDEIDAAFASMGDHPLRIVGIFTENALVGDYVIGVLTYDALYTERLDSFVLIKASEGADHSAVLGGLRTALAGFPNVEVLDQAGFRDKQAGFIDQLLGLVTALLMMAILIALFGIVNTLGLSIYERTRELGLLRAVGMSRRQTKRMIRGEAVIIAVFGAVLGLAVGVFFGWALQQALEPDGVTELAIPGGELVFYLIFSGLAGVIAAIWPARRAAKLDVLQAVSYE